MVTDQTISPPLPTGPIALPTGDSDEAALWQWLESVCDPEIPVLSLRELGVLRAVTSTSTGWQLWITPTYNGCPALSQMKADLLSAMQSAGKPAEVITSLAPAWSSDWITDEAQSNGISLVRLAGKMQRAQVPCPQCGSSDTTETSQFGSTACKAMYKCLACAEPFDYFKPY